MAGVDPAAVEKEKQALKRAFAYRSLQRDLDWLLDDTERILFAEASKAGRGLYVVASEFVLDCYYETGALEPLVKSYSGQAFRVASRFDRLLRHLEEARRGDLIERFWVAIARLTRAEFLYQRPRRDHGDHAGAEEFKNYALEAYAQGIAWMTRLGRLEAAERLTEERSALCEERLQVLAAPTDRRRIDEPVFWDLLSTARSQAPNVLKQLVALGESIRVSPTLKKRRNLDRWSTEGGAAPVTGWPAAASG